MIPKQMQLSLFPIQDQMLKLENLAKSGARIQPLKDGGVVFRTTETSQPMPPQIQVCNFILKYF
jgi:hypothetical protein